MINNYLTPIFYSKIVFYLKLLTLSIVDLFIHLSLRI